MRMQVWLVFVMGLIFFSCSRLKERKEFFIFLKTVPINETFLVPVTFHENGDTVKLMVSWDELYFGDFYSRYGYGAEKWVEIIRDKTPVHLPRSEWLKFYSTDTGSLKMKKYKDLPFEDFIDSLFFGRDQMREKFGMEDYGFVSKKLFDNSWLAFIGDESGRMYYFTMEEVRDGLKNRPKEENQGNESNDSRKMLSDEL
jgi:hypothetical protein